MSYAALIPYATPGFMAFGLCALPAGWLADKWSREGVMVIFFIGIGASSIATTLANTPVQIALGLFAIGAFVFFVSLLVWLVLEKTIGVRVSETVEELGQDTAELGIEAYPEFMLMPDEDDLAALRRD